MVVRKVLKFNCIGPLTTPQSLPQHVGMSLLPIIHIHIFYTYHRAPTICQDYVEHCEHSCGQDGLGVALLLLVV